MARKPRIEFEGAAYHVMSRGNGGADIFFGDKDRLLFLDTLAEGCLRAAWEVHAYVLMRNHYHLLLVTPKANLVDGMKWFQGTYTQRFNAVHRRRGHLYQGRYRAQNIDVEADPGYFRGVANYIHLNPARARLAGTPARPLAGYRWSSLPAYLAGKRSRPEWLKVSRVLAEFGWRDDSRGRKAYLKHLENKIAAERGNRVPEEYENLRRGWFLGDEEFKNRMLTKIASMIGERREETLDGEAVRAVGEDRAEQIVSRGLKLLSIKQTDLKKMRCTDLRKGGLAWVIKTRTTVSNDWIRERLQMGHRTNVSNAMRKFKDEKTPDVRRMKGLFRKAGFLQSTD